MFNCKNCGSKVNDTLNFCSNCGISLTNQNDTNDKKKFIELLGTNIKISNIKNFGVSISNKYYKAIKVPIYKINPKYIQRKSSNNNRFIKAISLSFTNKYLSTGKRAIVSIKEFDKEEYTVGDQGEIRIKYVLPYTIVRLEDGKKIKDFSDTTIIKAINEEYFIYWDYLYVKTYQNEDYRFYGFDINITEKLAELKILVNK